MIQDPVCNIQISPSEAKEKQEHKGETYYFCSKGCKTKFDANLGQFVKQLCPGRLYGHGA